MMFQKETKFKNKKTNLVMLRHFSKIKNFFFSVFFWCFEFQ